MPNNFMAIDQGLPRFTGEESLEQRVKMLQDYQYQLVEQLRYALQHLDTRNMNMDAMDQWGGTLTEPLYASLTDENGNMLSLAVVEEGISAKLWGADGDITLLEAKADSLSASVVDLAAGQAAMLYVDAKSGFIFSNETGKSVQIDGGQLIAGTVYADYLVGESVYLLPDSWENSTEDAVGIITITGADSSPYALDMGSYYAMRLHAGVGTLYLEGESTRFNGDGPFIALGIDNASDTNPICNIGACALVLSKDKTSNGRVTRRGSYGYNMPSNREGVQGQIYILLE